MLSLALKAGIPVIGVYTDDLVNAGAVIGSWSPKSHIYQIGTGKESLAEDCCYWTTNECIATVDLYKKLQALGVSLVVVNPEEGNSLIYYAGGLWVKEEMMRLFLAKYTDTLPQRWFNVFKDLSLKKAEEVLRITAAREGGLSLEGLRRTKTRLMVVTHGLLEVDTDYDFYIPQEKLQNWVELNKGYFLEGPVPQLRPRGVLLDGPAGVGKSMAAKYIARCWGVPLFRMDIATALDKYLGVSEKQVQAMLDTVEREAPAIMLIDEVEKLFNSSDDSAGTVTRIMSQLLWWLAEHQSRVLTVMTTNAIERIPKELYREGRVDMCTKMLKLSKVEAIHFGEEVMYSLLKHTAYPEQAEALSIDVKLSERDDFSHAEVRGLVYDLVKRKKNLFCEIH